MSVVEGRLARITGCGEVLVGPLSPPPGGGPGADEIVDALRRYVARAVGYGNEQ